MSILPFRHDPLARSHPSLNKKKETFALFKDKGLANNAMVGNANKAGERTLTY